MIIFSSILALIATLDKLSLLGSPIAAHRFSSVFLVLAREDHASSNSCKFLFQNIGALSFCALLGTSFVSHSYLLKRVFVSVERAVRGGWEFDVYFPH